MAIPAAGAKIPFGYCPKCMLEIWDKDKWMADGRTHAGCLGSPAARLESERNALSVAVDTVRQENERLVARVAELVNVLRPLVSAAKATVLRLKISSDIVNAAEAVLGTHISKYGTKKMPLNHELHATIVGTAGERRSIALVTDKKFQGQKTVMFETVNGGCFVTDFYRQSDKASAPDRKGRRFPVQAYANNSLSNGLWMPVLESGDAHVFELEFEHACEVTLAIFGIASDEHKMRTDAARNAEQDEDELRHPSHVNNDERKP